MVTEACGNLGDPDPYPCDKDFRDFDGKFAFVLFDDTKNTVFIAADADGSVSFFWGTDAEGHLNLSDDTTMLKKGCSKSYSPSPKGSFFISLRGLRSFEHPRNELKLVPRVDNPGDMCVAKLKRCV